MASIYCAIANAETVVVESNTVAGKKLLQSGGGRCNFTHLAGPDEITRAFGPKGRFLSYSLHQFTPQHVRQLFHKWGLESKVEQDSCVFPVTDHAGDVRDALVDQAKRRGVRFLYGRRISSIAKEAGMFIIRAAAEPLCAERLIITTGGLSWPQTGSTGDGYKFALEMGHTIVEAKASLVPLVTRQDWPGQLAGTAVENVKVSAHINNKKITTAGAIIFTDDGIGGPAVLDMSRYLTDHLPAVGKPIGITLDMAPQVAETKLETQFTELIVANPKKKVVNVLAGFVAKRLSVVLCRLAGCGDELPANQLKKDVRKRIVRILKALPLSIINTRPVAEATVTRGGVSTSEIETKTMESKICPGLFFAGEVIDVDGPCGGYNLQMCWSTGALAGSSAACKF